MTFLKIRDTLHWLGNEAFQRPRQLDRVSVKNILLLLKGTQWGNAASASHTTYLHINVTFNYSLYNGEYLFNYEVPSKYK